MDQPAELNFGIAPTPRQRWIFGLYAATLVSTAVVLLSLKGKAGDYNFLPVVALLSPWLLGLLVIVFDRPSPLRNWLAPLLLSLFYPCLALSYDAAVLSDWARFGQPPAWPFAAFVNVLLIGSFSAYLCSIYPRRCPQCSQRSLIPLLRLGKQEKRTRKTRWCGSCMALLWQDDAGQWRPERRATWLETGATPVEGLVRPATPRSPGEVPAGNAKTQCCVES